MAVSIEFLISATIVATIVILIGLLATRVVLHKSSSSARHVVWLLALVASLIGPVLAVVATNSPPRVDGISHTVDVEPGQELAEQQWLAGFEPSLSTSRNLDSANQADIEQAIDSPQREAGQPARTPRATTELANLVGDQQAGDPAVPASVAQALAEPATVTVRPWVFTAGLVWIVVAVSIVCLTIAAQVVLFVKRRRYKKVTEKALLQMCCDAATELGVRRKVTLLEADTNAMPMTWGVVSPVLLLPASAHEWSAERMRMVLLHELAHVRRYDCLWQTVSALAIACHWFNPLVWLAARRLRSECEQACDDVVLSSGVAASNYAAQLLDISTGCRRGVLLMCTGLAMARSKPLTSRLQAIVDVGRERTSVSRGRLLGAVFATGLMLIPISMTARVTIAVETSESNPEGSQKPAVDTTPTEPAVADAPGDDPYDTLYDVLMTRYGPDGKAYAQNETSPAISSWSEFPFYDRTFEEFIPAMNAFAALPQEKIDQYSDVKRALLQRHLWKVFDTTFNWDWGPNWWWSGRKSFPKTHLGRRAAVQPKIASLMRRLALTKEQILALPNPMAATVKSGDFAQTHDPAERFKPFLPADVYAKESSWICLGEDKRPIPASEHTSKLSSRSMFLQFIRLPGGRAETLEYVERIKKRPHQFPVGTQFALLEQPFLISNEGELVLCPMVTSVQLRAYLNVGRRFNRHEDDHKPTQCVAEFVMQPRELMKGNAVMKAMGPDDFRYDAGAPDSVGFNPRDPFETGEMPQTSRLNQCMSCHGAAGGRGVRTRSFAVTNSFHESRAEDVSKATSAQKRDHENWKTLQALWQGKSLPKTDDAKMTAKAEPEQRPETKPERFPDTPELRSALISRIETESTDELKKLQTATLLAETAKLSEMFQLKEADVNKLRVAAKGAAERAVEKSRDALRATVTKSSGYIFNTKDMDMTAFTINGSFIRFAPKPSTRDSVKKTREQNGSYIDASTGRWVDTTINVKVRRRAANIAISVGSFVTKIGPGDSDVQDEEIWSKTLSAVLTKEELAQYREHLQSRLKFTVVDLLLTALQFDLDLQESQLPVIGRRVEERVNPDPKRFSFVRDDIERTVAGYLQRLKAEDLTDILTKEQLGQFPERSKSRIKSTIVTLILTELQFDLHLPDSQLAIVRKRIEERINPSTIRYSIETAAMRIRWQLKAKDVTDVLTEPQRTLWRFTQEQH